MTLRGAAAGTWHRLRVPRAAGGVLALPPVIEIPDLLAANRDYFQSQAAVEVAGRPLGLLRHQARAEVLTAAWQYGRAYRDLPAPGDSGLPLILGGHQPSLFHPGVWFKNFALSSIARHCRGHAVHLIVDNDTLATPAIGVPTGALDQPRLTNVAYDLPMAEVPFEERPIVDQAAWQHFPRQVWETLQGRVPRPLLAEFWPQVLERGRATNRVGLAISQARHAFEAGQGLVTHEVPQSVVSQTASFTWAVAHLLIELARFQQIHNQALSEYRLANRVRSARHPVPELVADGPWLEAPLWVWTAEAPARRRLFVRQHAGQIWLTDRAHWQQALPLGSDPSRTALALGELVQGGIKLRPRALWTTLFARLFVGDLFVHGLGGAKYDELTDLLIHRFHGVAPPGYAALSATVELPIARSRPEPQALAEATAKLRCLAYHPETQLALVAPGLRDAAAGWAAEKHRQLGFQPSESTARGRCQAIRQANRELAALLEPARQQALAARAAAQAAAQAERVWGSREYAFCLFPAEELVGFLLEISRIPP